MNRPDQIDLAHASPFRLGSLVVEPALRQVARGGANPSETLEPRVMQVLVVLAGANGAIVSRDDLVRCCWEGRIVGDDSINRVIARLRRLTASAGEPVVRIETITKVGYRLIGLVELTVSLQPSPLQPSPLRPPGDLRIAEPPAVARPAADKPILAVLPFDNRSGDPELAYFSDGVSEEILHNVARVRGIRVIGKASSFRFRGEDKTPKTIVGELGASHMLDGSVRRAGQALRISVQLVDTHSQLTLWSERYDRAMTDIFAVQDEIAAAIAAALDAHFTPARTPMAIDPEAYDLYLQARAVYGRDNSHADQLRCIALLEATVAKAPDFAVAWGVLAMFRGRTLPRTSDDAGAAQRLSARAEAERALAIDPECGEAMMALALLRPAFSDYAEKTQFAESAFRLTRGDAMVGAFYAASLANIGRVRDACAVLDKLVAREPLAPSYAATRAWFYLAAGRGDAAAQMATEIEAGFAGSDYAMVVAGLIAAYRGDFACANAIVDAAPPGSLALLRSTLDFHARSRALQGAARTAWVERALGASHPVSYLIRVGLAAHVGEGAAAIDHLLAAIIADRPIAYDADDEGRGVARANIPAALFGVATEALRRQPRFAEACVRLGLYAFWESSDRWPDCVDEVAAHYDFRAECEKAARAIG